MYLNRSAIFQYKIITFQGQFSIIADIQWKTQNLYCIYIAIILHLYCIYIAIRSTLGLETES